jgi:DNA gyrase subunit A
MKEDDGVEHFLTCRDHDKVLFFSDRGVVYSLNAYQIPTASRTARGVAITQMLPIPLAEKITSMVAVEEFTDEEFLVMLTQGGYIKKTALSAFSNIRANGLIAISLSEGDCLRWVRKARLDDTIIISSRKGMAIHFRADNEQLRPLSRATRGVKSMNLRKGDEIISMDVLPSQVSAQMAALGDEEPEVEDNLNGDSEDSETEAESSFTGPWALVITTAGYGKRVPVNQFRLQRRAGKGVIAIKFRNEKDQLAALRIVNEDDELMMITSRGIIIRQAIKAISSQSRAARGVRVQRLDADDAIVGVALVPLSGEEDEPIIDEEE